MMKNSARFVRLSRHTRHSPIQETESEDFDQYWFWLKKCRKIELLQEFKLFTYISELLDNEDF